MFPLKDNIPTRRAPVVTVALILVNVAVFLFTYTQPNTTMRTYRTNRAVPVSGFDRITLEYGFTPCELAHRCPLPDEGQVTVAGADNLVANVRVPARPVLLTLLTAIFMHGGWLHIGGNMLFLWIFGNNVEDSMGRLGYLIFYLLAGVAASMTQFAIDTASSVPNIGASGAIAGVLGAYLLLFPRARVLTAIVLVIFFYVREIPALLVLGAWFLLQLFNGSASLGGHGGSSGVAYFAHIGGFVFGLLLVHAFARRRRAVPPRLPYA